MYGVLPARRFFWWSTLYNIKCLSLAQAYQQSRHPPWLQHSVVHASAKEETILGHLGWMDGIFMEREYTQICANWRVEVYKSQRTLETSYGLWAWIRSQIAWRIVVFCSRLNSWMECHMIVFIISICPSISSEDQDQSLSSNILPSNNTKCCIPSPHREWLFL